MFYMAVETFLGYRRENGTYVPDQIRPKTGEVDFFRCIRMAKRGLLKS